MADPLSILIGGSSQAHQQREAQISEAAAKQGTPTTPTPQAAPQQAPAANNPATGRPSFLSSVATTPPNTGQTAQKTLLGQ